MATSKTAPAKTAAKKTVKPAAHIPGDIAARRAALDSLRDIEANAKHDDPRQSIERLAKVFADALESSL